MRIKFPVIKIPEISVVSLLSKVLVIGSAMIGGYKGIVQSRQMESQFLRERVKNVNLKIELDSVETDLWAQKVLVESLSKNVIECHDDFNRLPFELWYKKMHYEPSGERRFIMMFVNEIYQDNILGARLSASEYISNIDYFAHPDTIAKSYWVSDDLVVRFWKKIRFHELAKMADGSVKTAVVEKWPERKDNDVYVFGRIVKYLD